MGTLRRNLVDLFTRDREQVDPQKAGLDRLQKRFSRLREVIVQLRPSFFDERLAENIFNVPATVPSIPGCDPFDLMCEFYQLLLLFPE
jgi:hypothetical protein